MATLTTPTAPSDETLELVQKYETYLRGQRGLSDNTVRVYLTDLQSFLNYLHQTGSALADMNRRMARSYLAWLATEARETRHPIRAESKKKATPGSASSES